MVQSLYDLLCPIGNTLFEDPVKAEDGKTYSREMITAWFQTCRAQGKPITSPWTRDRISEALQPDFASAQAVEKYKKNKLNPAHAEDLRSILDGKASIHDLREIFSSLDDLRPILLASTNGWQPPQLVMIGQESSGKSTMLERLAMMPIFPRDDSLCTRLPIHVQLRYSEKCKPATLEVFNTSSNNTEEGPFVIPTATGAVDVRNKMREIVEKEQTTISTTRTIILRINSPYVPSIDLVDLPGLVTSPPEAKEQTRKLLSDHIKKHESYSLYLVTCPASTRANTSPAIEVLQEHKLQSKTIGVFTMCDEVGAGRPWQAFMRALQTPEVPDAGGVVLHPHGWVGVSNAELSRGGASNLQLLSEQAQKEEEFVLSHMSCAALEGKVGCASLVRKINDLFLGFLKKEWGPQTVRRLGEAIRETEHQNACLGTPSLHSPEHETAAEAAQREIKARQLIVKEARSKLAAEAPNLMTKTVKLLQTTKTTLLSETAGEVLENMSSAFTKWEEQHNAMERCCRAAINKWGTLCVSSVKESLEQRQRKDQPGISFFTRLGGLSGFNLARFPAFISAALTSFAAGLEEAKAGIQQDITQLLTAYYRMDQPSSLVQVESNLTAFPPTIRITGDHSQLVERILCAFVRHSNALFQQPLPLDAIAADLSGADLVETCAEKRSGLLAKKGQLEAARTKIASKLGLNMTRATAPVTGHFDFGLAPGTLRHRV